MMKGMLFAERYKLEEFIGQGGMSLVYRAVDIRTGHSVAVKILKSEYNSDKEFLERFQREAQAASLMSHHNIVNLLDVGVEGEYRYLVLEYVSGNTLKDIIRQKGRLNWQTTIQVAVRILSALQHAHDNGIIHRDIKPQNVLIHADGHVKVADFGIARMTNAFTISKGDTVVGSVHYSSPEQASGSVVECTSDLYSTGIVMYEMLTGRVPFVGDTPVAVAMQHIKDTPPPIPDFAPEAPPALVAVVMKAMAKNPKDRFQSAREMADALLQAREGKLDPELVAPQPPAEGKRQPPAPVRADGKPYVPSGSQNTQKRSSHKRKRNVGYTLLTTLLTLAALALLTIGAINIYDQVANRVMAPDLADYTVAEASSTVRREGLIWTQTDVNSDIVPAGYVISQIPAADTPMRTGDSMLVTISLGPVQESLPSYVGTAYDTAYAKLKDMGFTITVVRIVSTEPIGTVLQQRPQAGSPFTPGQDVELTISGGSTLVPNVMGMPLEEATASLTQNSQKAAEPLYAPVLDESQIGKVISQSPAAGTQIVIDGTVTLTIGVAGAGYTGEVIFNLEAADQDRTIRVVLLESQGEREQHVEVYPAGQSGKVTVPLVSAYGGSMICRIYVDDEVYQEQAVTLQQEEQ